LNTAQPVFLQRKYPSCAIDYGAIGNASTTVGMVSTHTDRQTDRQTDDISYIPHYPYSPYSSSYSQ
jgi:hypothetical protein